MTGAIIGLLAGTALLLWVLRRAGAPRRDPPAIDREELEAAERELDDLGADALPEEDQPGDDWGPGAGNAAVR
jgi:hypothetical protein